MSVEAPRGNCCARFAEFISSGCLIFWNGLADLIQRVRNCFCRSTPTEQLPPPPLIPDRVADLTPPRIEPTTPTSTPSLSTSEPQITNPEPTSTPISPLTSQLSTSNNTTLPAIESILIPLPAQRIEPTLPPVENPLPLTTSVNPGSASSTSSPSSEISSSSASEVIVEEEEEEEEEDIPAGEMIATRFCDFLAAQFVHDIPKIRSEIGWRDSVYATYLHIHQKEPTKEKIELIVRSQCKDFLSRLRFGIGKEALRLFSCLSAKDQMLLFKKLCDAGLTITLPLFFTYSSSVIKDKIKSAISQFNENVLSALIVSGAPQTEIDRRRALLAIELQRYYNLEEASYAQAWDSILQSTLLGDEMQAIADQNNTLSKRALFAQKVISLAFSGESIETYLSSSEGAGEFNKFSVDDKLWIIECLAACVHTTMSMNVIKPSSIALLINTLPRSTKENIAKHIAKQIGPNLLQENSYNLVPTLTILDIERRIFPLISNNVRGTDHTLYII